MAISFLQVFGAVISELRWLFVVNIRTKPPFWGEGGEVSWEGRLGGRLGLFEDAGGGGAGDAWLVVACHFLAESEGIGGCYS